MQGERTKKMVLLERIASLRPWLQEAGAYLHLFVTIATWLVLRLMARRTSVSRVMPSSHYDRLGDVEGGDLAPENGRAYASAPVYASSDLGALVGLWTGTLTACSSRKLGLHAPSIP